MHNLAFGGRLFLFLGKTARESYDRVGGGSGPIASHDRKGKKFG